MTLTYGSLFSGVGGFDMGFDQAEYECVFQVEWDKNCQQILTKHWPEVPKWLDVQEVNGAEIPPCDVLTFGSPCQDLSVAGKRAGLDGDRSSMFYEATRIIKEMRDATKSVYPRIVVWENVPGAITSNNGADFGQVLDTLADIGAVDIHWSVLDAQYFGVPQRRRRIFVVAIFDPATAARCPETLLPVFKGSRGDFAKGRKARKDAARVASTSFDSSNEQTIGALCARDYKGVGNQYVAENKLVVQEAFVKSRRAQNDTDDETWIEGEVTPTLKSTQQPPSVSPPGLAVRRLTPLECERLMGWPDDHTRWTADGKEQADTNRYKQCGNGVATPVARWIAQHIRALL